MKRLALVFAAFCLIFTLNLPRTQAGEPDKPDADVPVIQSITPNWTPLGKSAELVIKGNAFSTDKNRPTEVYMGKSSVLYATVASSTEIRAIVPASDAAGWVQIEVRNPDNQSASAQFHYGPIRSGATGWVMQRLADVGMRMSAGGSTMYIILVMSVLALAWFIHCLFYLNPARLVPGSFARQLVALMSNGDFGEAQKICEKDASLLGRVALAGIRQAPSGPQKIADAIQSAGSREATSLFQKVTYLSNVGVISPMLGLFGTVIGMIMVFDQFAHASGPNQSGLASGVSLAFHCTAFGLIVGIASMCAFYFLRGRVVRIVTDLEEKTEEVVRSVKKD